MLTRSRIVQSKVKLTISPQPDLYQYYCVRCVCCIVRTAYSRPLLSIQREVYALLVVQATRLLSISLSDPSGPQQQNRDFDQQLCIVGKLKGGTRSSNGKPIDWSYIKILHLALAASKTTNTQILKIELTFLPYLCELTSP